jgi:aminoglycoside N3'-acetyltransferase
MRKTASKQEIEMLVSVDHATHILDLKVFTSPKKRVPAELVGTASLRMQDLRDVVEILSRRLQIQDWMDAQAEARKARPLMTRLRAGALYASGG